MGITKLLFLMVMLCVALLLVMITPFSQAETSFVVIGDMPYLDKEIVMMTAPNGKIYKAIRGLNPSVLIHLGDFKNGGITCTNELLQARQQQIAELNPNKIIYTPGDNDWVDCDRKDMAVRYDELERLDYLRKLFFSGKGAEMFSEVKGLERQKEVVENTAWKINNLQLGVINLPGTNNGRNEILKTIPISKVLDVADRRDKTNVEWLNYLFKKAASANGLVIAFHEDIYRPDSQYSNIDCTDTVRQDCNGLKMVRDHIETKALAYKKPVLVIHGSTNAYCFHQPVIEISNLWRLNAPGDYKYSDIAKVIFNADNQIEPFSVMGVVENRKMPLVCDYSR